ncbi:hypothetical protein IM676_14295 [Anabaenopsis elenkinii CCIBt3563]|uniref:Uncharacterized protein n=1 Tax=Anabaenopsis elenkinii CCIBt3563 TaxID=2779889 RepID=A0A7U3NN04_9CYAN|nr:hypothetical protein IM676_14295 [Anabaenopsis elenkinii CCIBt3563]
MYVIILTECVAILYTPLPLQGDGLGVGSNLIPPSTQGDRPSISILMRRFYLYPRVDDKLTAILT